MNIRSLLIFVLGVFTIGIINAQNNSVNKKISHEVNAINIAAKEKVNYLHQKRNDSVLLIRGIQFKAKMQYDKKMNAILDKYEDKSKDKFKEAYKYELAKRGRFTFNQDKQIELITSFFRNKESVIEKQRDVDVAKAKNI